MRHAEQVTFGGSGLDRAAELRGDTQAIDALASARDSRIMVLWRLKPMLQAGGDGLAWLAPGDPVLADADPELLFLGRDTDGSARFAANLAGWSPDGLDSAAMGAFLDPTVQLHPAAPEGAHFAELRAVMTRLTAREAELAATARGLQGWHDTHRHCARCGAPSEVVQAGWQRSCAACGAAHFPRTDPVVIMLVTHGNDLLLGRSPGWPEGMYSLLAGFIEPGETMEAAVRREVAEEAGIAVGRVGYLASQPWVFPSSLMFGCWGQALDRTITLDPAELEDALWIGREELCTVLAGEHPKLRPARQGAIAHFLIVNWLADRLR